MTDERQLITQAQKGDNTALSMLFQQHYSFLIKYLTKVTMNVQTAEDLTQEALMRCMEKLHLYNGRSKFSTWLITIATRLYIDELRKKRRERRWQEDEHNQTLRSIQWQLTRQGGEWPDVLNALHALPYDIRVPIILKHYYGYTQEEIADMLEVPAGTIKSRIHYGLKNLRKELGDHDED
jgi:RNA polymerase sigma-70 factor (ECF subfamily)